MTRIRLQDFQDNEETKPDKLSVIKLQVIFDDVEIDITTETGKDRRDLLRSLFKQFQDGGHEFVVRYGGKSICSSSKIYLTPADCNSIYLDRFFD